jgi:23S rRNA pseudouridine1911/1915/1917 synthase
MDTLPEEFDESEENSLFEHHRVTADPGQSLIRVDKFLTNQLPHASRSRIQAAAEAGSIRVNDLPVKASYKVKPGDVVVVMLDHPKQEFKIIPEDIPLNIVYEDDELLIINKRPGLVVHPGHGNYSGTLVNALSFYLKNPLIFSVDDPRPGLVHFQFYEKTTHRKYVALVWGDLKQEKGTIEGNIGRSVSNRQIFTVYPEGDHGKTAVTHYKVIERLGYVNLIECRLETGRTHQIRVHMKYIGHPLFNDAVYGGNQILRGTTFAKYRQFVNNCFEILPRQALHAKSLGFLHPVTGKLMLFDSELPDDMAQVINKWRNYIANRENN